MFGGKRIDEDGVKSCAIPRGTEARESVVVPGELPTRNLPGVFSLASPAGWMDNEKSFSLGTPAGLYITRRNSLVSRPPGSLHFAQFTVTRGKRRGVNRFAATASPRRSVNTNTREQRFVRNRARFLLILVNR